MNEFSRSELRTASIGDWSEWLRDGLLAFTRLHTYEDRVHAFGPLAVDPLGHNPAGDLEVQIRSLVKERISIPSQACARILDGWSLILDGWQGAAMGLQVAIRLGSPALFETCIRLLNQIEGLPREGADWLAWLMTRAATERFTRVQIVKLGHAFGRSQLWRPSLMTEYAALLARDDLPGLPKLLLTVALEIIAEPHTGEYARPIARRLALDHDREALRAALAPKHHEDALAPKHNEDLDVFRIRQALAAEIGVDRPDVVRVSPLRNAEFEREFDKRVNTMAAVSPMGMRH